MAELTDIRAALAAAINGAFPDQMQCDGYVLSQPVAPFVDIELAQEPGVQYDQSMARGLDLWRFTVRLCVSYDFDKQAQMDLDKYCAASGATSMKQALENDRTLGGTVENLKVVSLSGYRTIANTSPRAQPSNAYLGAEWTVEIYARGTS